jgi:hypothetical protein
MLIAKKLLDMHGPHISLPLDSCHAGRMPTTEGGPKADVIELFALVLCSIPLWRGNQRLESMSKHFNSTCPQGGIARLRWQADDLRDRKAFLLHPPHAWLSSGDIPIERSFHCVG